GVVHHQHLGAVVAQDLESGLTQGAAQAVADRVGREVGDPFAPRQRVPGLGRAGGLGQVQAAVRRAGGQRQRRARGQATAAHRHHQGIQRPARGQQFERRRALAGDHRRIGIGMDQARAGGGDHLRAGRLARGDARRAAVQHGAVPGDRGQLGAHRVGRCHHVAGDAAGGCGQRQRRAVVARGVRGHAVRGRRVGQLPDGIAGAAELERAAALQVLGLERQLAAGDRVQAGRAQQRRGAGMRDDPGRGGQDIVEIGHGGGHGSRLAELSGRVKAQFNRNGGLWDRIHTGGRDMRKLLIVLAASLVLAGCATGYGYSSHDRGYGDYYYGSSSSYYGAYGDYGDYYYSPYAYPDYYGYGGHVRYGYGGYGGYYGGLGHYGGLGYYGGWYGRHGYPWYGGSLWYGAPIYVHRPPHRPRPPRDDKDPEGITPPPMSDPLPPNRLRQPGDVIGGRAFMGRDVISTGGNNAGTRSRLRKPPLQRPGMVAPPRTGNGPPSTVPRSRIAPPESRLRSPDPRVGDGPGRVSVPASSPRPRMST